MSYGKKKNYSINKYIEHYKKKLMKKIRLNFRVLAFILVDTRRRRLLKTII